MRTKKLTDYTYSPTNPASEDAIRTQIDDSIQEVYDFTTTSDLVSTTVPTAIEEVYAKARATVPVLEITDARTSSVYGAFGTLPLRLDNTDVKISNLSTNLINVMDYGALNDDTDPTTTTQAIINAHANASDGDTIYIPGGIFAINDTITITKRVHFICYGDIKFYGTRDRAAFHFVRPVGRKIEFNGSVSDQITTWHGWANEAYTGIIFENAFRCKIFVKEVRNFTTNIRCLTQNGINFGFFFNTFDILQLNDGKIQLEIYQKDVGSWFNSNIFNNIFFTLTQSGTQFQTEVVDRFCIKQTHENNTTPIDTNIFYNARFDIQTVLGGTYTGVYFDRATDCKFENYRAELVSNSNVKMFNFDLQYNQIQRITLNPVYESFTSQDNVKVNLLNATSAAYSYNDIYKKTGIGTNLDNFLIYEDKNWYERYRRPDANFGYVDKVMRYLVDNTLYDSAGEKISSFGEGDQLIDNGVTFGTYYQGVLYLKGIQEGDIINVRLKPATTIGSPTISLKSWDVSNTFIANNEINVSGTIYKAISSASLFWDNTNKRLAQNVGSSSLSFTVNRTEVKTIAILFSGGLSGIEISANRNNISVLRSIIPIRNRVPHHTQTAAPTYKTEGYYLAGDIVYNSNTTAGQDIAWQLVDTTFNGSGTLAWRSLGKYV